MRKNFIFLAISLVLAFSLCFISQGFQMQMGAGNVAYAKCSMSAPVTNSQESSSYPKENVTPDDMGAIPFALYTTKYESGTYSIVDYIPSFKEPVLSGNSMTYEIAEDSIPYIFMSSTKGNSDEIREGFYNTTLYFKFNNQTSASAGTSTEGNRIESYLTTITLRNNKQAEPFSILPSYDNTDIDNVRLDFAVNLIDEEVTAPLRRVPKVNNANNEPVELGSGNEDAVSFREGLYTFEISYIPVTQSGQVGKYHCTFVISFYVLDYDAYSPDGDAPLDMFNADKLTTGTADESFYLFNYNYDSLPYIEYDASKYAINFEYSVPTSATSEKVYAFNYQGFTPSYDNLIVGGAKKMGEVYLYSPYFNDTYTIPVYDHNVNNEILEYTAIFDLDDFEQNYILNHSQGLGTACCQGIYHFNLEMLTTGINSSETFEKVNSDTIPNAITKILQSQNLVIYGYDLRYNDAESGNDVPLKNDKYSYNLIAINDATDANESMYINIPEKLITTNLTPLNFHSYGNLTNNLKANFILDTQSSDKKFLNDYFSDIKDIVSKEERITEKTAQVAELEEQIDTKQEEYEQTDGVDEKAQIQEQITELQGQVSSLNSEIATLENAVKFSEKQSKITDAEASNSLSSKIAKSSLKYTQSSTISGNGIWLMELKYQITIVIDGKNELISGTQYVAFRIDNTAQTLTAHAVEFDASNNLKNLYTFNQYTKYDIRISTKYADNAIMAPIKVSYKLYRDFNTKSTNYSYGDLTLKANDGQYSLTDGDSITDYQYYVLSQSSKYTFSVDGTYVVTISSTRGSAISSIIINKESNGINNSVRRVYTVDLETKGKTEKEISKDNNGIYMTSSPFTLEWTKPASNSTYYTYIGYMGLGGDSLITSNTLFQNGSEYYLTNEYAFSNYIGNIEPNYANSYGQMKDLTSNQYFKKDGIYFFYVYDKAGNYFTETILLDSTMPATLQGSFINEGWVEDNVKDNNYVNKDTTLFFGTHKSLRLPIDDTATYPIDIKNNSYVKKYNSSLEEETTRDSIYLFGDDNTDNDFYDFIKKLNMVKKFDGVKIGLAGESTEYYYYNIANTNLYYEKLKNGVEVATGNLVGSEMGRVNIYRFANAMQTFSGEAQYEFVLTAGNGLQSTYYIEMNFDLIVGTFYAYNDNIENKHSIQKDAATNMNFLAFEYSTSLDVDDDIAEYYVLDSLTYDYYAFDYTFGEAVRGYPLFNSTPTRENVDILSSAVDMGSGIKRVSRINVATVDSITGTSPGKYVITRKYRGGTHEKVDSNVGADIIEINGEYYKPTENGIGGTYVILNRQGNQVALNLFELDTLERSYTVYVDRNGIISRTYIASTTNRQVGNEITLNFGDEYKFVDFFKTSINGNNLVTNKIPVQVNIPYSKYFGKDNKSYYASTYRFAKLNITIKFYPEDGSASKTFVIDSKNYDLATGMCKTSSGELLRFSDRGRYVIEISDNTGYNDLLTGRKNIDSTSFSYTFYISYTAPSAELYYTIKNGTIVNETSQMESENDVFSTNINTGINENSIYVYLTDNETPYTFNVKSITISNNDMEDSALLTALTEDTTTYTSGLIKKIVRKELSADIFDNNPYQRYAYEIYLNATQEGEYNILLSYDLSEDDPSYNFSTHEYVLNIDRTKPNNNIYRLIEDDLFLSTYELYKGNSKRESQDNIKSKFLEENFNLSEMDNTPSVFTYAFPINNSFALSYNSSDTLNYFYVRNYDKFTSLNTSDSNPSITPDMTVAVYGDGKAYYENETDFGGYNKFSEVGLYDGIIELGSSTYYRIEYANNVSLYSQILSATGVSSVSGYYEIIERDPAGNFRCYTVYFAPSGQDSYKMLEFSGIDEDSIVRGLNEVDVSGKSFTLQKMSVAIGWGKVTITTTEDNIDAKTIIFTPSKNYISEDELNQLHSNTGALNTINNLDRKITLTLSNYNSMVKDISRQINLSEGNTELSFSTSSNGDLYSIILPKSKKEAAVYLTTFKLSRYENSRYNTICEYFEATNPEFFENRIYSNLEEGRYLIEYKDNIHGDTIFRYFLHLGGYYINDPEIEYQFEYEHIFNESNQTYYSGGDITITYEARIYVVKVNGLTISGTDNETPSNSLFDRGCMTFTLSSNYDLTKDAEENIGGETSFVVEYYAITDVTALQKTKRFVICDYLPEITLTDASSGQAIKSSIVDNQSQVTNTTVKIDWGNLNSSLESLSNATTATLYRKNTSTNKYEVVIEEVSRGTEIYDEGNYKLQIKNSVLGNYRNAFFSIQMGEVSLFTITVNDELIYPSSIEKLSLQSAGLINNIFDKMTARHESGQMRGVVERNQDEFSILIADMGYKNNSFSVENIGISNVLSVDHYYTTSTGYNVNYNSMLNLKEQRFIYQGGTITDLENIPNQVGNTYYTTIYLVYTLKGPIRIKFFAVTVVPNINNLLAEGKLFAGDNSKNKETIELASSSGNNLSKILSNNNGIVKDGKTSLSWYTSYASTASWYNQGNYVYVLDQYGEDNNYYALDFEASASEGRSTSIISGSGTHKLMFKDLAGNTHQFSSSSFVTNQYVYTLSLIDQVIYYVEYNNITYNPAVQYAVYNDSVNIVLDKTYLSKDFYTLNKVSISVTKNGVHYNGYTMLDNVLTFTETGKYVLSFDAKYESRSLNTATYNFTILSSDAARLAYEFVEVSGYEITSVIKDGENITDRFKTNGKVTSLFISSSSNVSGNGRYEITMKYGSKESDILNYSFFINDYIPIIYCNVEHGGTTTGDIVLTYDKTTLYEQLGKCYINIKIYNNDSKTFLNYGTIEISKERNNSGVDTRTISLSNSYFIQIQTENGNIISSYRVDKTDPLNAFAIIAIVLAVLGVIALVIIIIKLRTRMKIR